MVVPSGWTENQILYELDRVISGVMRDFTPFGPYRGEELRQECFVFGIEALAKNKYDNKRPIAGFLRTCIINRCISLARDKNWRNDEPCKRCPFHDPQKKHSDSGCKAFDDKMKCEKFKQYYKRNETKRNLFVLHTETPLFDVTHDIQDYINVDNKDYVMWLAEKLSPAGRQILAEIIAEKMISKTKLERLKEEVSNVIANTSTEN